MPSSGPSVTYEITELKDGRCDPTIVDRWSYTSTKDAVEDNRMRIVELIFSDKRIVKALWAADGTPPPPLSACLQARLP